MSRNPYVRDPAAQAHEKFASKEARSARKQFMTRWEKMSADMEARLASAGITVDDEPEPDMSGIHSVDYTRRVEVPTNLPINVSAVESISKIYAAEADLLNTTARAAQEWSLTFGQDADTPRPFGTSAADQELRMQALVANTRGTTDDVLRKTYSVYNAGPTETHRVLPSSYGEELLQDWAKKRGPPNALEVDMLSQYIGVDIWVVYDWFKAKSLQTQCVDMMAGEALSRSKEWRKIGLIRYRAAKVESKWTRHLAWLREQHRKSKADQGRNKADKDGNENEADVTLADVRGEMKPFVSEEMD